MENVCYVPDGTDCTVVLYKEFPEKYRGNIQCDICLEKSWFVKGFSTEKYIRAPCFAAHHAEGCKNKITLIPDEDGDVSPGPLSVINIDLDKQRKHGIDVVVAQAKSKKVSIWGTTRKYSSLGDYPENKSLRQILTKLSRELEFSESDKNIKMVADGGRIVLEGAISEHLVSQADMPNAPLGEPKIFWGRINNVNRSKGGLWLNCGNYKKEPSVLIGNDDLEEQLLEDFRLKNADELQGADFIVVGVALKAGNGKPYIKFGFTKYIALRKYRLE